MKKKNRKVVAVILTVALIMTMVPTCLFASAASLFGSTTEIATAEELLAFAEAVNSGDESAIETDVELTADIDLTGKTWTPIGTTSANAYTGTFDGKGHTISGIRYTDEIEDKEGNVSYTGGAIGVFGYLKGTVQDLVVADSTFTVGGSNAKVGAIAGAAVETTSANAAGVITGGSLIKNSALSEITKCAVKNDVTITLNTVSKLSSARIGGVVGSTTGIVTECWSGADVTVTAAATISSSFIGGIAGYVSYAEAIKDLIGALKTTTEISDTYYTGTITNTSLGSAVGGIAGYVTGGAPVSNSYSIGTLSATNAGGIVGKYLYEKDGDKYVTDDTVKDCYYYEGSAGFAYLTNDEDNAYVAGDTFNVNNKASTVENLAGTLAKFQAAATGTPVYPFPTLKNAPANATELKQGTIYNPYLIKTATDFNNIRNNPDAVYKLANDIYFRTKDAKITDIYNNFCTYSYPLYEVSKLLGINGYYEKTYDTELQEGKTYYVQEGTEEPYTYTAVEEPIVDDIATYYELKYGAISVGQLKALDEEGQAKLIEAGYAKADDFVEDVLSPIPEFNGILTGDSGYGYSYGFYNLDLNVDDAQNAAIFVKNYGTIADINFSGDITLTAEDKDITYMAAGIAAINYGTIQNVESGIDVSLINKVAPSQSGDFGKTSYVAGIAVDNYGYIIDVTMSGVPLFKLADDAIVSTSADENNFKLVAEKADIKVGGLVVFNETQGYVSGDAVNSARSELIADGAKIDQFIVEDYGTTGSLGDASTYNYYLAPYDPGEQMSADAVTDDVDISDVKMGYGSFYVAEPSAEIIPEDDKYDNYQLVSITAADYWNVYNIKYFRWLKVDPKEITVTISDDFKDEYVVGDALNKATIADAFTVKTADITLPYVSGNAKNGYTIGVYADKACTIPAEDLNIAGVYYVQLKYGNTVLGLTNETEPETKYITTFEVFGVKTLSVKPKYETYMVGQDPTNIADKNTLSVIGTYGNSAAKSTGTLDKADYTIAVDDSDKFTTEGEASIVATYTYDRYTDEGTGTTEPQVVKSEAVKVTVVPADVALDAASIEAITSSTPEATTKVSCDDIYLTWTSDLKDVKYRIYRNDKTDALTTTSTMRDNAYYYKDTAAIAGTDYTYKVVIVVAGEESTGFREIAVTSPLPTSVYATKANNFLFPLGNTLSASNVNSNVTVMAKYANDTTEKLSFANEDATTKDYKLDFSPNFNSNKSGEYTATVKWNGNTVNLEEGAKAATLKIKVVPPTELTLTSKYSAFPQGYDTEAFEKTLTVLEKFVYEKTSDYPALSASKSVAINNPNLEIKGFNSSAVTDANKVTATFSDEEGNDISGTLTVRIVPNAAPATVTATAGETGLNEVTWDAVDGAVKYTVYRSTTGAEPVTEALKTITVKTDTELKYVDESAIPDTEYTYSVSATIADVETEKTAAENVTTVAPVSIKATFGDKILKDYALGTAFTVNSKTTNYITVTATYANEETREIPYDSKVGGFTYQLDSSDYKATEAITEGKSYPIYVTYLGERSYNEVAIGSYEVTVHPVTAITATLKEAKFALGTPIEDILLSDNLTVKATSNGKSSKTTNFAFIEDIYDEVYYTVGSHEFTVVYLPDGENLPEPENQITAKITVTFCSDEEILPVAATGLTEGTVQTTAGEESALILDLTVKAGLNGASVSKFKSDYLANIAENIKVYKPDGTTELKSGNVTTGCIVKLYDGADPDTAVVIDAAVIIIPGDCNATPDGKISSKDYTAIKNHIMEDSIITDEFKLLAADITGDTKVSSKDYTRIKNLIMNA